MASPTRSVPLWISSVATTPLVRSISASMTLPKTLPLGLALMLVASAVSRIASSRS